MTTSSTTRLAASLAMVLGAALPLHAADATRTAFDPLETFAPFAYPHAANAMRDASGRPGPAFWQNRADYTIKATLEPSTRKLSGSEIISYTNHSPDALDVIWLQVEQNRYTKDARGAFGGDSFPTEFTDGEHIRSVEVEDASGHRQKAHWVISDTRMQVTLPTPLKAHDGKLKLHIVWDYTVPGEFGGRTDWNANKQGDIFEMAQWYPRVCVYDDLRGWDTQPFLNSEFYLEYGDFDYRVTVPSDMIVVGSGELLNPQDVLTKTQRERLDKARHSDATVMIRTAAEVTDPASRPKQGGTLTWHFAMKHTRDVAFGASKAYIWDAARMNLPDGKTALAMSAYPVESAGDTGLGRGHAGPEEVGRVLLQDLLPVSVPGRHQRGRHRRRHGVPGHHLRSQEGGRPGPAHADRARDRPHLVPDDRGQQRAPRRVDGRRLQHLRRRVRGRGLRRRQVRAQARQRVRPGQGHAGRADRRDPEGSRRAAADDLRRCGTEKYRHPITYFKSAFGLVLLREQIIGPERFDPAFRRYIATWAYKHPSPSDFFRFMDSAAGEDLELVLARLVRSTTGSSTWPSTRSRRPTATGTRAPTSPSSNHDQLVLPTTLQLTYADGSTHDVRVPVETWMQHRSFTVHVDGDQAVTSAVLDPEARPARCRPRQRSRCREVSTTLHRALTQRPAASAGLCF